MSANELIERVRNGESASEVLEGPDRKRPIKARDPHLSDALKLVKKKKLKRADEIRDYLKMNGFGNTADSVLKKLNITK